MKAQEGTPQHVFDVSALNWCVFRHPPSPAGSADAAVIPSGIGGFIACKALSKRNDDPATASRPWDRERDGFVMGEGAGEVVPRGVLRMLQGFASHSPQHRMHGVGSTSARSSKTGKHASSGVLCHGCFRLLAVHR